MTYLASDVINYATSMLAQPQNTIVAGLPAGTGENDVYAITAEQQSLEWINEAQNQLALLCTPIYDQVCVRPAVAGQSILGPYTTLITPGVCGGSSSSLVSSINSSGSSFGPITAWGRTLHRPLMLSIGSAQLNAANVGFLSAAYNWYPTDVNGNPTGWADTNTAIQLSNYTTQPLFVIEGYFLPAPVTSASQILDPAIDSDGFIAMSYYLAWRTATKNLDNQVLANRIQPMFSEYASKVKNLYNRVILNDPTLSGLFAPEPIDAIVQLSKAERVNT
jgi:hypothetical protein